MIPLTEITVDELERLAYFVPNIVSNSSNKTISGKCAALSATTSIEVASSSIDDKFSYNETTLLNTSSSAQTSSSVLNKIFTLLVELKGTVVKT